MADLERCVRCHRVYVNQVLVSGFCPSCQSAKKVPQPEDSLMGPGRILTEAEHQAFDEMMREYDKGKP